ncbi:MAG: DNA translocase FtsK 4TM domain-containing protein [Planctomycetota bacterium]
MFDFDRLKTDLLALGLLALAVFAGLSFLSYDPADPPSTLVFPQREVPLNICGIAGATFAWHLLQWFGAGVWLLLACLISWDLRLFLREPSRGTVPTLAGTTLVVLSATASLHLLLPQLSSGSAWGSGGRSGAILGLLLSEHFSTHGILILTSSLFVAGLLLTPLTDLLFPTLKFALLPVTLSAEAAGWTVRRVLPRRRGLPPGPLAPAAPAPKTRQRTVPVVAEATATPEATATLSPDHVPVPVTPAPGNSGEAVDEPTVISFATALKPGAAASATPGTTSVAVAADSSTADRSIRINAPATLSLHNPDTAMPDNVQRQGFSLPDPKILEEPEEFPYEQLAKKARVAATTLERAFVEFGLNVKVAEIDTGPVVTQFELELEKGLRLNRITALEDDLAIALRVPSVRVVAPIPGRNTVGVEVPNDKQVMVRLRELLQTGGSSAEDLRLPLFLGKDVSGRPLVVDLAKMPHLLIAGRTGTGKSVCLNTLILSLLMVRTPDEVRMLMIDPKMVELSPYKRIPHLMHPVITDMRKAETVLAWAVDKMEERYDLLARVGVRHLEQYNRLGRANVLDRLGISAGDADAADVPERMPYIVIIADEMADLMMTSGKDVEACIIRLAQKSRAVGIHLVLATQKPTVDVITGLIKSNLPARISFQVASKMDSRVVLDESGAERLLGSGDMLYLAPATSHLTRAQGTYVSDEEINAVIDFFSDSQPEYSADLMRLTSQAARTTSTDGSSEGRIQDDLYDQAVEIVIREGRGSVSLLQRSLGVGYGRAARMIDYMAEDGVVGDYNGAHAREVICTLDDWQARSSQAGG